LKQAVNKRKQVVANILAVVEDILETTVVGDINETTTARK
jgi:hypothetical protein